MTWLKYNLKDPKCKDILHLYDYFFVVWEDDRYADDCDMEILCWDGDGFYRPELAGDEDKYLYKDDILCFMPVRFPVFTPEKFLEMKKI